MTPPPTDRLSRLLFAMMRRGVRRRRGTTLRHSQAKRSIAASALIADECEPRVMLSASATDPASLAAVPTQLKQLVGTGEPNPAAANVTVAADSAAVVSNQQSVRYDIATRTVTVSPLDPNAENALAAGPQQTDGSEGLAQTIAAPPGFAEGIGSRQIHGGDDRVEVTDTRAFPARTAVKMYMQFPSGNSYIGSGIMVGEHHVLTCGHCIYDAAEGGWASSVRLLPAQDNADASGGETGRWYGEAYATSYHSYTGWTANELPDYDWGVIELDRSAGNHTGWVGLQTFGSNSTYTNLPVDTYGYPGDLQSGEDMYTVGGPLEFADDLSMYFEMDVLGGQSGSGIIHDDGTGNRAVGVVAYSSAPYNFGPRMNSTRFDDLLDWIANDPDPTERADLVAWDEWFNTDFGYVGGSVVHTDEFLYVETPIRNNGTLASGSATVSWYASTNDIISTGDTLLGTSTLSSIDPLDFAYANASLAPPAGLSGDYYIGYIVDSGGAVSEYSESNNNGVVGSSTVFFTGGPSDFDDQISEAYFTEYGIQSSSLDYAIDDPLDVDMFFVEVVAGQTVRFDIDTPGSPLDARIRLFDAAGTFLDGNDDGFNAGPGPEDSSLDPYLEYTFSADGTYYFGVSAYQNASYDPVDGTGDANTSTDNFGSYEYYLEATDAYGDFNDQIGEAFTLTKGVAETGFAIGDDRDVDMFAVAAVAGETLSIDIDSNDSGLFSVLRLFDAAGNELAIDNGSPDAYLEYTVAAGGTYYIGVSAFLNDLYDPTTGENDNVATDVGAFDILVDSVLPTGDIEGTLWNDANGDGVYDAGEAALIGWTVYLDLNENGILDTGETSTTTDGAGFYQFTGIAAGDYQVRQVLQTDWVNTYPTAPGTTAADAAGVTVTTTGSDAVVHALGVRVDDPPAQIGAATAQSGSLINLDLFRADPRFAGIDGSGYSVVIMDTGIDEDHPFFGADADGNGVADRIVASVDFTGSGSPTDIQGHGSNVASIALGEDATHTGMAPGANIISLKVLGDDGSGSFAWVEQAMQWVLANAATYNIAAINLSLGDGANNDTPIAQYGIDDEFAALDAAGIVSVAAAGNDYFAYQTEGVSAPASDPFALAVGAVWDSNNGGPIGWGGGSVDNTTAADRLTSFSQRSATMVDIFAPGAFIVGAAPGGGTSNFGGTSQAAPHIAGIAALAQELSMQELGRLLTPTEFKSLIDATGVTVNDGDDEDDNVTNTGHDFRRIDVLALGEAILAMAGGNKSPQDGYWEVTVTGGQVVSEVDFGNQVESVGDPDDQITEATLIGLPDFVSDAISDGNDVDMYQFDVFAGDTYTFAVDSLGSGLDAGLWLFDFAGNLIEFDDDDGPGLDPQITRSFANTETVFLAVGSYDNFGFDPITGDGDNGTSQGAYQLSLGFAADHDDTIGEAAANGTYGSGSVIFDAVDYVGDVDLFEVFIGADETYRFDVDTFGAPDSILLLFDQNGVELGYSNDDAAPGEPAGIDPYLEFSATDSGFYYIGVSDSGTDFYDPITGQRSVVGPGTGFYELHIDVVGLGDPPAIDRISSSVRYVENRNPNYFARSARVFDTDTTDFGGAVLTVDVVETGTANPGYAEDFVGLRDGGGVVSGTSTFGQGAGVVQIAVSGVGVFDVADAVYNGSSMTLAFRAGTTASQITQILRRAAYMNDSENPDLTPRHIQVHLTDPDGNTSAGGAGTASALNIVSVADPTQFFGFDPAPTWTEGGGPAAFAPVDGITVLDPDTGDYGGSRLDVVVRTPRDAGDVFVFDHAASARVSISGTTAGSTVFVDGFAVATLVRGTVANRMVLDFLGGASAFDVGLLASLIKFDSSSDDPRGPKTVAFTMFGGDGARGAAIVSLDVVPVNDPPAIANVAGRTVSVNAGGFVRLASSFTIADPDYNGGGGTIAIDFGPGAPVGLTWALDPDPSGRVTTSGNDLFYNGVFVGTAFVTSQSASFEFNANASFAAVRSVGRLIAVGVAASAVPGSYNAAWQFLDDEGAASPIADMSVNVVSASLGASFAPISSSLDDETAARLLDMIVASDDDDLL